MKTVKLLIFLSLILSFISCGKKTDPIPKVSLDLTPPKDINLTVVQAGIEIKNLSDNITLYAEKVLVDDSVIPQMRYDRVGLIKPSGTLIDTNVMKGKYYNYRFANYFPEFRTYSSAIIKGIKYVVMKELGDINIETVSNTLCVTAELTDELSYANLMVNGKFIAKLYDTRLCTNIPPTANIDVLIIPYDNDNYSGVPYQKSIVVDQDTILLPPQNVKVFHGDDRVSLSWDKVQNVDSYLIYRLDKNKKATLLDKTTVTLYSYRLKKSDRNKCIDFELRSVRAGIRSDPINITACK